MRDLPDNAKSNFGDTVAVLQSLRLADGRRLFVRIWPGTGEETIVFLHGLLDSSEGWAATCERRTGSDGRPTLTRIAFDLPGFGQSDPPVQGSLDGYARDIMAGIEQLGVRRFILVGHSLGGGVATRVAELMADRVEALVLLAPVGFGRIRIADLSASPLVRDVLGLGIPHALASRRAVSLSYRLMVTNGSPPEPALLERLAACGPQLVAGTRHAVTAIARASHEGFQRRLVAFDGPVVAIWGAHDRLVPPVHRHVLQRVLPQAAIHVWAGMGHHPQQERLEDLLMMIRRISAPNQTIAAPRVATRLSA